MRGAFSDACMHAVEHNIEHREAWWAGKTGRRPTGGAAERAETGGQFETFRLPDPWDVCKTMKGAWALEMKHSTRVIEDAMRRGVHEERAPERALAVSAVPATLMQNAGVAVQCTTIRRCAALEQHPLPSRSLSRPAAYRIDRRPATSVRRTRPCHGTCLSRWPPVLVSGSIFGFRIWCFTRSSSPSMPRSGGIWEAGWSCALVASAGDAIFNLINICKATARVLPEHCARLRSAASINSRCQTTQMDARPATLASSTGSAHRSFGLHHLSHQATSLTLAGPRCARFSLNGAASPELELTSVYGVLLVRESCVAISPSFPYTPRKLENPGTRRDYCTEDSSAAAAISSTLRTTSVRKCEEYPDHAKESCTEGPLGSAVPGCKADLLEAAWVNC
ncbi:hypothetical protein BP5796_09642 [Coleophoma crateriformis]|uniref:Uncharacterized protein n=1 Tax=Coleophoma crateriformis TaxID=565419 RepID=A0A3D8QYI9_9HELO|nr:hypothetical protein BP5796_09642 [Coleophoma crateriformis]